MAGETHPPRGAEVYGPMDLRSIEADDIAAARAQVVGLLREIKAANGHRAAVTGALAAIAGAVDALVELGAGGAAMNALHSTAADLERRGGQPQAGEGGRVLH